MSRPNLSRSPEPFSDQKAWRYFKRSARLRCPVCGISPLFLPARRTEGILDWFAMLPGCPRCGYRYEREPGYFLFPLWLTSFGLVPLVGVGLFLLLDRLFELSTPHLIVLTLIPMWLLGILAVRHVKAFYLAFDHLLHPHVDDEPSD